MVYPMSITSENTINWSVVIPWFLTLATAGISIWQFIIQERQKNRQPFLQRQLELCFQAAETVGRLTSDTDAEEWEKARVAFWRLYWGPLSIVEDRAVESAMVELGKIVPVSAMDPPKLPMVSLGVPSYRLAHAVRNLVLTSWDVSLPALQDSRQKQM
jgi:hypothetical protein